MNAELAPYTPDLAAALITLWNRALGGRFPLTERLWRQNIEGDPSWSADDALVLRLPDASVAGFVVTRRFRQAERYPALAPLRHLGWITALAVDPPCAGRGFGTQLLAAAEDHLRRGGATRCDIGGSLGHLLPGPPADDRRARRFWQRHGYAPDRLVHDLRRSLAGWTPPALPPAAGWRIAPGEPHQRDALLTFLDATFPGRWHYHIADSLARGAPMSDLTLLLAPDDAVSGFVATWHGQSPLLGPATNWFPALGPRYGGIGPLGIATAARGQGLGLALVAAAVAQLHARGVTDCAIDWTNLTEFYARLGFVPWRSYWRCAPKSLHE